jgi:hypothetical protein
VKYRVGNRCGGAGNTDFADALGAQWINLRVGFAYITDIDNECDAAARKFDSSHSQRTAAGSNRQKLPTLQYHHAAADFACVRFPAHRPNICRIRGLISGTAVAQNHLRIMRARALYSSPCSLADEFTDILCNIELR